MFWEQATLKLTMVIVKCKIKLTPVLFALLLVTFFVHYFFFFFLQFLSDSAIDDLVRPLLAILDRPEKLLLLREIRCDTEYYTLI